MLQPIATVIKLLFASKFLFLQLPSLYNVVVVQIMTTKPTLIIATDSVVKFYGRNLHEQLKKTLGVPLQFNYGNIF